MIKRGYVNFFVVAKCMEIFRDGVCFVYGTADTEDGQEILTIIGNAYEPYTLL